MSTNDENTNSGTPPIPAASDSASANPTVPLNAASASPTVPLNAASANPTVPLNAASANPTVPLEAEALTAGIPAAGQGQPQFASPLPTQHQASHSHKPWSRRRKAILATIVAIPLALGVGGSGVAAVVLATAVTSNLSQSSTTDLGNAFGGSGATRNPDGSGTITTPQFPGQGRQPQGSQSQGSGGSDTAAVPATAAEKVGVVTIVSTLNYDPSSQAAGTGMILSANGLILTNNHVVEGSTGIEVTVESTGKTYSATVVGTDKTDDVAVIRLKDARGLTPVTFDTSGTVAVGDTVHSVGNASGTGNLVTATGTVTALNQSITVQSDTSATGESLKNLIEISSDVVAGDSGGPLFDAGGEVAGIITAASSGAKNVTGYAIDIDAVLPIVKQIEAGKESATVKIGYPAFLGVQIANAAAGAAGVPVGGAFTGMPAANAGIVTGDTITAVDGTTVATAAGLSAIISAKKPGDSVSVTWTSADGSSQTASIVLGSGPAA